MEKQMQEQIIRKVTRIGNGAHIFAPKGWVNDEVLLVRIPKPNLKEEIINVIKPYLENIIAVFLFGSYARKEQDEKSDIDILVISEKKMEIRKREGFHFVVIEEDKLKRVMEMNPIFFFSLIREAKPLINPLLLKNLKKEKLNLKYLKEFIESSRRMLKMNKELVQLDKLEEKNLLESESVIYSVILRLRGVFLIESLIEDKVYSASTFKEWIERTAKGIEYKKVYEVYRAVRDRKESTEKVRIEDAEKLVRLLEQEICRLEKEIKNAK